MDIWSDPSASKITGVRLVSFLPSGPTIWATLSHASLDTPLKWSRIINEPINIRLSEPNVLMMDLLFIKAVSHIIFKVISVKNVSYI